MSEKTLKEKIGWKPAQRVLLLALPEGVADPFAGVEHASMASGAATPEDQFDLLLGFVADAAALETIAPAMLGRRPRTRSCGSATPRVRAR